MALNAVFFVALSLTFCYLSYCQNINYSTDPAIYYSTVELICSDGYPAQEHKVVTDDGYILTVHRIPNGKRRPKVKKSKYHYMKIHKNYHPDFENCINESKNETGIGFPVIVTHGILMGSDGWILQGPGYDFVYLLADAGYDVWLVNIRGNFYSRDHTTLDPSEPKFWDFSFHENAKYDLPAIIDYSLKNTGHEKVFYVGYSLGTMIFFTMCSIRPEYNDKILEFVGLAPVAYIKMNNLGKKKNYYEALFNLLNEIEKRKIYELFPRKRESILFLYIFCSKGSLFQDLCYDLISPFIGYHSKQVLRNKLHLYVTHLPTGTSLKTLVHLARNIVNNELRQFDYGPPENRRIYGRPVPPDYPLWNVTAPVALYYTDGDFYYDLKDEDYLRQILPNIIDVKVLTRFNHGDFIWSYKAKDLVYKRALNVMGRVRDLYLLKTQALRSRYGYFENQIYT